MLLDDCDSLWLIWNMILNMTLYLHSWLKKLINISGASQFQHIYFAPKCESEMCRLFVLTSKYDLSVVAATLICWATICWASIWVLSSSSLCLFSTLCFLFSDSFTFVELRLRPILRLSGLFVFDWMAIQWTKLRQVKQILISHCEKSAAYYYTVQAVKVSFPQADFDYINKYG